MDDMERYLSALHAVQTGIAHTMDPTSSSGETSPKHLRVGVNSALCNQAGLVRLLIAKGLITEEEYVKEMADEMEREKERYQKRLSPNGRVTLA